MATTISLPEGSGSETYTMAPPSTFDPPTAPLRSRVAYAAAHVVSDPLADYSPGAPAKLDWDATMQYRHHLWDYGLGVADAMDTAQRGMGLDWPTTRSLIQRSALEAKTVGGMLACGVGTDQMTGSDYTLDDIVGAYEEQCEVAEQADARLVLMASRQLAEVARSAEDYYYVYDKLLSQVKKPALLHWLGPMFDPALEGYWGTSDLDTATEACLTIIHDHASKVDGLKLSLLDMDREINLRQRLPKGVRMYSGDDFNYTELIQGDNQGHSDAFLGAFDAIAPAAANAIAALDGGDVDTYVKVLQPTVPLARHIFGPPTPFYKTGVVFIAYLNGHQNHFRMVNGLESSRSIPHLIRAFVLADKAGILVDPGQAARRLQTLLTIAGFDSEVSVGTVE